MADLKDMRHEEVRDPGPHEPGRRSAGARGWGIVVTLALIAVGILLTAAIRGLVHDRPGVAPPAPVAFRHETPNAYPAPPTGATEPGSPPLADVSYVDVRTGIATPLPRSIRKVGGWVGEFQVSPDGDRLAFTDGSRVYVATAQGRHVRAVTNGPYASGPSWSPDGTRIVFTAGGRGWIVDVASGATTLAIPGRHQIYHPSFSPDGHRILFSRVRGGSLALWTVPVAGGEAVPLLRRAAFGSYSPDGSSIAYRRTSFGDGPLTEMTQSVVWVADADGGDPRSYGRRGSWMSQIDPLALWPMWSPDGTRIAYEPLYRHGVDVINVATGRREARLDGVTNPVWLDDHTLIVEEY